MSYALLAAEPEPNERRKPSARTEQSQDEGRLLERIFKLTENQTTVRRELLAGGETGSAARFQFTF